MPAGRWALEAVIWSVWLGLITYLTFHGDGGIDVDKVGREIYGALQALHAETAKLDVSKGRGEGGGRGRSAGSGYAMHTQGISQHAGWCRVE